MVKIVAWDCECIFIIRMKWLLLCENDQEINAVRKPVEFHSFHFGKENMVNDQDLCFIAVIVIIVIVLSIRKKKSWTC